MIMFILSYNVSLVQLLNILAVRRQQISVTGKTEIPVPHTPPPHPGYAPNAAFHAIKRHALEVINHRDAVVRTSLYMPVHFCSIA